MKYLEFKEVFGEFPLISSSHFFNVTQKPRSLRNRLTAWQKEGLVVKLRKGLYIFNEKERKINPSRIFIANALYSPSYVSSEYALDYYDLIPERVEDVTSVTTKKTTKFENALGTFRYQHLKPELFFGFIQIQDENGLPLLVAEPEKAMLDFIYLNLQDFRDRGRDVFTVSYRFQNLENLGRKKLELFGTKYRNKVFLSVVKNLLAFIVKEGS